MDLRLNVNKKIEDQSQEKTGHFLKVQDIDSSLAVSRWTGVNPEGVYFGQREVKTEGTSE